MSRLTEALHPHEAQRCRTSRRFLLLCTVALMAISCWTPAGARSPDCSDASYNRLLQRGDDATAQHAQAAAAGAFREAAELRLICAKRATGDNRALLLDDYAGTIENAASSAVGAGDYVQACRLARGEVSELKDQLQRRDMSPLWRKTLKSRLSGTYMYLSACTMPAGYR
jgi:hypothetical protein